MQQETDYKPSNATEDAWVWTTEEGVEMFFDRNETVRFRVEAEVWTDLSPEKQPTPGEEIEDEVRKSPFQITVSFFAAFSAASSG